MWGFKGAVSQGHHSALVAVGMVDVAGSEVELSSVSGLVTLGSSWLACSKEQPMGTFAAPGQS